MSDPTDIAFEDEATAWAGDPERADPDEYPSTEPYFKQMTWAPCDACSLQAHIPLTLFLYRGLQCPRCQATLLRPPEEPQEWLQRVLQEEADFFEQASS